MGESACPKLIVIKDFTRPIYISIKEYDIDNFPAMPNEKILRVDFMSRGFMRTPSLPYHIPRIYRSIFLSLMWVVRAIHPTSEEMIQLHFRAFPNSMSDIFQYIPDIPLLPDSLVMWYCLALYFLVGAVAIDCTPYY